MLISHGELMWGESETACAERWRFQYGIERGTSMAKVFAKTAPSRAMNAYWRRVESQLGEFLQPRGNQAHLKKEFENKGKGSKRRRSFPRVTMLKPNTERN